MEEEEKTDKNLKERKKIFEKIEIQVEEELKKRGQKSKLMKEEKEDVKDK